VALSRQQALRAVRLTSPSIHGVVTRIRAVTVQRLDWNLGNTREKFSQTCKDPEGRFAASQAPPEALSIRSLFVGREGGCSGTRTEETREMAEDSASEPKPPGSVTKKGGEAW
jgi:hypothetical protein